MKLFYMAHPLGSGPDRDANIANAKLWFAWLNDHLREIEVFEGHDVAVVAPWITLAEVWTEDKRERGLEIDRIVIRRCHGIVLCGGRISPGMAIEAEWAREEGLIHRFDLSLLGPMPPSPERWAKLVCAWP